MKDYHSNRRFPSSALILGFLGVVAMLLPSTASALSTTLTSSASSALANNTATFTFTVVETGVDAPPPGYPGECYKHQAYANGDGNTLTPTDLVMTYNNGTCTGTFTLKSSVAGTKTVGVKIKPGKDDYQPAGNTVNVAFTAPAAATPKPATPTPVAATPTPAPTPTPPAAPSSGLKLNNQALTESASPSIKAGESIVLSGNTVANGVVTLYIFSTPRQATVTANAQGAWSYTLTGLEAGAHHVEATVSDPTTKLSSERTTVATFKIAAVSTPSASQPSTKQTNAWLLWTLVGLAIVGIMAAGIWWYRKRQQSTPPNTPDDTTSQA